MTQILKNSNTAYSDAGLQRKNLGSSVTAPRKNLCELIKKIKIKSCDVLHKRQRYDVRSYGAPICTR